MGQETPEMLTIQDVRYGLKYNVNSEFLAVLYFRKTLHAKFRENKILAKCKNHPVVY